jgi:hypothetical protein
MGFVMKNMKLVLSVVVASFVVLSGNAMENQAAPVQENQQVAQNNQGVVDRVVSGANKAWTGTKEMVHNGTVKAKELVRKGTAKAKELKDKAIVKTKELGNTVSKKLDLDGLAKKMMESKRVRMARHDFLTALAEYQSAMTEVVVDFYDLEGRVKEALELLKNLKTGSGNKKFVEEFESALDFQDQMLLKKQQN